jgi:hypothetical protein
VRCVVSCRVVYRDLVASTLPLAGTHRRKTSTLVRVRRSAKWCMRSEQGSGAVAAETN